MTMFVAADHGGNLLTCRPHAGMLVDLNNALIDWFSKQQSTVESPTFGSESVACRIGLDKVEALRYKLRMMGIPIEGPCNVFCDNQSLVITAQRPESTLKKKHNTLHWHHIREAVAKKWQV